MRHSNKFAVNKWTENKEICPSPAAYLCSTYTDDYRNQDSKDFEVYKAILKGVHNRVCFVFNDKYNTIISNPKIIFN